MKAAACPAQAADPYTAASSSAIECLLPSLFNLNTTSTCCRDSTRQCPAVALILQALTPPGLPRLPCAADPYTDSIKQYITVPTVTYALRDREADVYVTKFNEQNIWGTDLEVRTPFGLLNIFTDQVGKQNVYNILCAVATGLALGTISLTVRIEDSFSWKQGGLGEQL